MIHSLEGKYTFFADFDQSWAQLYWYQWYRLGKRPENFIIRTDAAWESPSRTFVSVARIRHQQGFWDEV